MNDYPLPVSSDTPANTDVEGGEGVEGGDDDIVGRVGLSFSWWVCRCVTVVVAPERS